MEGELIQSKSAAARIRAVSYPSASQQDSSRSTTRKVRGVSRKELHFRGFLVQTGGVFNRRIDMISTDDVRELIEHKAQTGSGVLSVYLNVDQSQAVNLN